MDKLYGRIIGLILYVDYLCLYLIFVFFYILLASSFIYITHLICLFTSFLLILNFIFSKIKMLKLLFILFVIKQLLGNLTSDIGIYSATLPTRES